MRSSNFSTNPVIFSAHLISLLYYSKIRSINGEFAFTYTFIVQGVWIWGTPIDGFTPDGEPIQVLVLDTEGLGATDEE